jgi:hypothetical protein
MLSNLFSAVTRASCSVFMFYVLRLIFGGTEGVGSRFHVLCARRCFRRCRVLWVPFECFALPDLFSTVPRASDLIFMFCAPGIIFYGIKGVRSRFQLLSSRTCFLRYRVRRVPFSCFVHPDSLSAVPRATGPGFMFCALRLVFGGTESVRFRFHVFALRLVFDGIEGIGSRFHVLRARTRFRRYQGPPSPFSCFSLPDMFLAVRRALGPVFMFCTPGVIFGETEGVGSYFHVMGSRTHFRRYRGCRVPFSCFALPNSFSAVPWASGLVFMFCTLGLIFDGTVGVGSRFLVLHSLTSFRRL